MYLTHGTELLHMFHIVLGIQSFSAMPYSAQWFLWPLYPLAILVMGLLWVFGKPFLADKYRLPAHSLQGETWVMPRYSFQVSQNDATSVSSQKFSDYFRKLGENTSAVCTPMAATRILRCPGNFFSSFLFKSYSRNAFALIAKNSRR